jgi:hypothetical protein
MNTARYNTGGHGTDNTSAIVFAGDLVPGVTTATETWNGSSWTEVNDMSTARETPGAAGNSTAALGFGGSNDGTRQSATEEFGFSNVTTDLGAS